TQSRVTGTCPSAQSMTGVNQDGTVACAPIWSLTGNTGINPNAQFIGTTDAQPLVVRVNNFAGFRVEPGVFNEHNIVGGSALNVIDPDLYGSTIGGGGQTLIDGRQHITGPYSTIAGGAANTAGHGGAIGGGVSNTTNAFAGTVPGGVSNLAGGSFSFAA